MNGNRTVSNRSFPILLRDALILGGTASFVYGAWLAWHPLGLMLAGVVAASFGLLWQFQEDSRKAEQERNRRLGI
jgi:hypothetical protein